MLKVGLTGGIGSGKTVVAEVFKTLGIPVFNADNTAKKMMEEDQALKTSIKQVFGEEAYINNQLNKKYIANIVFNDAYQLEVLNSITHPAIIKAAEDWMQQQTAPYCIKEAALLFETGSAANLDYIIGVKAPDSLRIHRVMQRENISRADVLARMNKQISQTIKMKLCNFIIHNDEQHLVIPQIIELHNKLLNQ